MKYRNLLLTTWIATLSLIGCTRRPSAQAPAQARTPTPVHAEPALQATATLSSEAQVRLTVQGFGARLKMVSLLAPDAAQEIQAQYSEFATPDLIEQWTQDPTKAPGRLTSSPWPDRIEIDGVSRANPTEFKVSGSIVEVTSVEAANGGAAEKIPVRLTVQNNHGGWLISEYQQGQPG